MKGKNIKVIVSGGGTGGHIFPAVSIANAIKAQHPDAEILFVGALGRMEMQRVPDAGYKIIGLPIQGFSRKNMFKNIAVLFKIWKSQRMAKKIIKDFQPDVAVGVGGYASGPLLNQAAKMGVPTLIQEQNSYAGVTNKLLAKKARKICVAYDGRERFFPADKIIKTGNPVRQNLVDANISREQAAKDLGLDPQKKTILVIGGSLGARTVNESILQHLDDIRNADGVQIMWQHGKFYSEEIRWRRTTRPRTRWRSPPRERPSSSRMRRRGRRSSARRSKRSTTRRSFSRSLRTRENWHTTTPPTSSPRRCGNLLTNEVGEHPDLGRDARQLL